PEQHPEDEGNAPAPRVEAGGIEEGAEQCRRKRRRDRADRRRRLLVAADQATPPGGGILDEKGGCASPFPAGRKALQQTTEYKDDRPPQPDRRIGRGETCQ